MVPQDRKIPPCDYREYDPRTQILTVTNTYIKSLLRMSSEKPVDQDVISFLETAFKSLACLNGSFLLEDDRHYYCTSKHHGIDMRLAENAFDLISKIENQTIQDLVRFFFKANINCNVCDFLDIHGYYRRNSKSTDSKSSRCGVAPDIFDFAFIP